MIVYLSVVLYGYETLSVTFRDMQGVWELGGEEVIWA